MDELDPKSRAHQPPFLPFSLDPLLAQPAVLPTTAEAPQGRESRSRAHLLRFQEGKGGSKARGGSKVREGGKEGGAEGGEGKKDEAKG